MVGRQERFGERLRRYREAAGYSQEDLAERAGISANALGALERGERKRPYPDTLRRLAEALDLDADERLALASALRAGHEEPAQPGPRLPEAPVTVELPGEPTPLIGRDREVGVVRHLLAHTEGRLLTLLGPGGVGKTRLALHVARAVAGEYVDGVWWVDLGPLNDPALVLSTIARTVGLEEQVSGDAGLALRAWLRDRQVLLVLDNVEHLMDAVPDVARLLQASPGLRLLATSRAPLNVRGEQEYLVPPLELPVDTAMRDTRVLADVSAIQFFTWQAQQRSASFVLTAENAPTVAAICRRLDGLPLAMELVAARIRVLSPADLLLRLDHQMPLLVGGARDLPRRQQTMRAAIAWSYDLLSPDARSLFRRLAVFAGGWSLEAAEAVGAAMQGADADVVDLLDALIEQSLVTVTHDDQTTRYGMLEPIRQFAQERLEDHGEGEDARRHHAIHFQAFAEEAAAGLEGHAGQASWLSRLEREHDNLRAALTWGERAPDGAAVAVRLATALWRFWEMRWHVDEGSRWLAAVLARSDDLPADWRASALNAAGNLARDRGAWDEATAWHEESLALRRTVGDLAGIARSLNNLGVIARDRGDAARTLELCQESLALFRQLGDRHRSAIALISLGTAASQLGDVAQARAYYEESLALFRASGDDWHVAWVLTYLAELHLRHGDVIRARSCAGEGLALHRVSGDHWGIATALGVLGKVSQAGGDVDGAARHLAEALRLLIGARVQRAIPQALGDLAEVLHAQGDAVTAARLAGMAEAFGAQAAGVSFAGMPANAGHGVHPGTGEYAAAWEEGRVLGREAVLAEAWSVADRILAVPPPTSLSRADGGAAGCL